MAAATGGGRGVTAGGRTKSRKRRRRRSLAGPHGLAWIGGGLWVQSRYGEAPPYSPDTRYVN